MHWFKCYLNWNSGGACHFFIDCKPTAVYSNSSRKRKTHLAKKINRKVVISKFICSKTAISCQNDGSSNVMVNGPSWIWIVLCKYSHMNWKKNAESQIISLLSVVKTFIYCSGILTATSNCHYNSKKKSRNFQTKKINK